MTEAEFFVFEEIINLLKDTGQQATSGTILSSYNYVQTICCTLHTIPLQLRRKTIKQIEKALRAHDHDATLMAALFKKQVELHFTN